MVRAGLRFSITPATTATHLRPTRAAARAARSLVGQSLPPLALLVPPVLPERPDPREPLEQPVPRVQLVLLDQQERREPLGQQARQEQQVPLVQPEQQDPRAQLDRLEQPVPPGRPVPPGPQA